VAGCVREPFVQIAEDELAQRRGYRDPDHRARDPRRPR
jgi:hypothetical protein